MFLVLLSLVSSSIKFFNEERSFISWMRSNNNYYIGEEYHFRLGLYISRIRYIQEFNKRTNRTFKVGLNKLSCYTPSEYQMLLGFVKDTKKIIQKTETTKISINAPDSIDWRDKGVVNSIKDQARCGSCWAFSAICTCESSYALKTGRLLSFSEQNFVDCVPLCYGCNGGSPLYAIKYVIDNQNGQFNSEESYPYKAVVGTCSYDSSKAIGKVTSYHSILFFDEDDLLNKLVEFGPVSVSIDSSLASFHSYSSGIYSDDSCSQSFLDHAVNCIGYGSENGIQFWIVRNSWGTSWGEQGYFRLLRGSNMCGIASSAIVAYV